MWWLLLDYELTRLSHLKNDVRVTGRDSERCGDMAPWLISMWSD